MEFEVNEGAVKSYQKYTVYRDWKLKGEENAKRPFRPSMYGYYLVSACYIDYCIVGDILTSNKVWGNARERNNNEINNALSLFQKIYHSIGNYIPIPEIKNMRTGNLSGYNCDTYTHHLNVYKDAIEEKLKSYPVWQKWAKDIWLPYCEICDDYEKNNQKKSPWERFVEEFYLYDFVDEEKKQGLLWKEEKYQIKSE